MQRVLFIDRDGTLIQEPADEQIDAVEKFDLLPDTLSCLRRIAASGKFELVMVTNQDGLGTDSFPEQDFWPLQDLLMRLLASEEIQFSDVLIDRTFPEQHAPTRKPGTALLYRYLNGNYDLENSYVIGDRMSDIELAKNLGSKGILITDSPDTSSDFASVSGWKEIEALLREEGRIATQLRITAETNISGKINLDGSGSTLDTGLPFLDHMLDQIARHGQIELDLKAEGDLDIDPHHTVEDVAIVLGQLIRKALGSKMGISRYGFSLPMDEARADVVLDLGGRYTFQWDVEAQENEAGGIPLSLWKHFFDTLAQQLACNLHIQARGENAHHVIEGSFKAFARALRMACASDGTNQLPSTKSMLS